MGQGGVEDGAAVGKEDDVDLHAGLAGPGGPLELQGAVKVAGVVLGGEEEHGVDAGPGSGVQSVGQLLIGVGIAGSVLST